MLVKTNLDFNNESRITNLPEPTSASDAVPRSYVDAAIEGLAWKDAVRVSSTSNINLASPGSSIDGVTLTLNDRVLIKDQDTAAENGIYIYNGSSTPMTRSLDASTFGELENATVTVAEGTSAGSTYRQTSLGGVLGTNDIEWVNFGVSTPAASESTAGIAELATQSEVNAGSDTTRIVTPATLNNWTGRLKRYETNIGDGTATTYAVTHNMGTRDVTVKVYLNSGSYAEVLVDVEHTDTNTVTVKFTTAPSTNSLRVVVKA